MKWQCYQLTTSGKITIAKSLLLSQYTYIGSVLEISDTRAKHIQDNLNSFIFYNKPNKAGAIVYLHVKEEVLYGRKSEGGFGMLRVDDFFHGLKCSWIKRYTVDKIDDHWADMLNMQLKLTPSTRQLMLELGAEKFNVIVKKNIPCISGFIKSYQFLKHNFPTDIELKDNRWLTQPVFYNKNIITTLPGNSINTGVLIIIIVPTRWC